MKETQHEKPRQPEDWECCGSGCSPCVWDHYYEELEAWRQSLESSEGEEQ